MADVGQNSFDNLTHSGLLKLPSKDDKNVSLQIDVWGGNTSLVVFTGAGGKPWKHPLPAKTRYNLKLLLMKMRAEPRTMRDPIMLNAFVEENGKRQFKEMGQLGIGIDENLQLYIDIAHNELSGRHLFPVKGDSRFDYKNTSLQPKDMLIATIDWIVHVLIEETAMAERLSSFKRAPGGGGGFNRGGGGGGGNRSGGYGGGQGGGGGSYGGGGGGNQGGGQRQQSGGTFSGGGDDDLHV